MINSVKKFLWILFFGVLYFSGVHSLNSLFPAHIWDWKARQNITEMYNPLLRGIFFGDLSGASMFASDSVLSDICKAFQLNRIFQESLIKMQ